MIPARRSALRTLAREEPLRRGDIELTEDVDTVPDGVGVDVRRSRGDCTPDGVEDHTEEVALQTTEVIGNLCDPVGSVYQQS